MFTLTSRKILVAVTTVALLCVLAFPAFAFASNPDGSEQVLASRELVGRGVARQTINGENVTSPANFTLTLKHVAPSETIHRFTVATGTINVNGRIYSLTPGTGAVLRGRHAIVLEAQGTDAAGNPVTFRLAGRYFWMGGHLFVFRTAGALQTESGKIVLLSRAAIKI